MRLHPSQLPEDILDPTAFDERAMEDPSPNQAPALRRWLNLITLIVIVVGAAATFPWWQPGLQHNWSAWFPAPPYAGPLIYGIYGGKLTALRATDGRAQWTQNAVFATGQGAVAHDLIVIAGLYQGRPELMGIQARSGKLLWGASNPAEYNSPDIVGVSARHIYVWYPSPDGVVKPLFITLNRLTGTTMWSTPSDAEIVIAPHLDDKMLVFCGATASGNFAITARDAATGALRWTATEPLPQTLNVGPYCYQSSDTVILQAQFAGTTELAAFALSDGKPLWQARDPGTIISLDDALIFTSTSPRATPNTVLQSPELTARDAATGRMMWQVQGDLADLGAAVPQMAQNAEPDYFADSATGIIALARSNGAFEWRFDPADNDPIARFALFDGRQTLVYSTSGGMYALDARSGQIRWREATPLAETPPQSAAFSVDGSQIFLQDATGVSALDSATGRVRWRIDQPYQLMFP